MRADWLIDVGPWQAAEDAILSGRVGKVVELAVQAILNETTKLTGPNSWLEHWTTSLTSLFGQLSTESTHQSDRCVSSLLRFADGPIVRLFADSAVAGSTPAVDFEVIGTDESWIFRSHSGLIAVLTSRSSNGSQAVRLIRHCDTLSDLDPPTPTGRPLQLGVVSLDHPHAEGNHLPALTRICSAVNVAAIADPDRSRCEHWLKHFGARYYPTRDAMLNDPLIDVVLITSRNCDHARDAIAAANAGKDILCDKPIATTPDDASAIIQACRRNAVRFVTTYPCRHHPVIIELKQQIASGALGRIQAILATNHGSMYHPPVPQWITDPESNGGGCLMDHTVHVADLIRWLTGQDFHDVHALADTALRDIQAEDIAVLHGTMTDGTVYQIDASWARKHTDPPWGDVTMRIVGTTGSATIDLYNSQAIHVMTRNGVEFRYPHALLHQHGMVFLDYHAEKLHGSAPRNASHFDGVRTIELVFAAYRSIDTAATVQLPHPDNTPRT